MELTKEMCIAAAGHYEARGFVTETYFDPIDGWKLGLEFTAPDGDMAFFFIDNWDVKRAADSYELMGKLFDKETV